MPDIGRRVRNAVNPLSTAATGWWCRSALRHMLTGHGPTARQRRIMRHGRVHGTGRVPSAEQTNAPSAEQMNEQMKKRAAAIDALLAREDRG